MGSIVIERTALHRLIADGTSEIAPYQRRYNELGLTHRGRPIEKIVPLLRSAAAQAQLGFKDEDLAEQARAISNGARYELRVTLI
ncbi:hypothetical protein [Streptomyces xanthochromogenes]|uniref:hypothetical protein n=1 Tax=Streptomyces xanthochromogenes TaxID=67384 RepID=UPI003445CDFF